MLRFLAEERGASSAEFVLIFAVVGLGAFVAFPGVVDLVASRMTAVVHAIQHFTRYAGY